MACSSNCNTCKYKQLVTRLPEHGHCYMFAKEPDGECCQWRLSDIHNPNLITIQELNSLYGSRTIRG